MWREEEQILRCFENALSFRAERGIPLCFGVDSKRKGQSKIPRFARNDNVHKGFPQHSLFRIPLTDLPLDLRQDSTQDSGVVVGEVQVEQQAPQLE